MFRYPYDTSKSPAYEITYANQVRCKINRLFSSKGLNIESGRMLWTISWIDQATDKNKNKQFNLN